MNATQQINAAETIESINARLAAKDSEIREATDARTLDAARAEYGRLLKAKANAMVRARFN